MERKYPLIIIFFILIFNCLIPKIYADISKDMQIFSSKLFSRIFFGANNLFNNTNDKFIFNNIKYTGTEYVKLDSSFLLFGGELGYMFEPFSMSFQLDYSSLPIYKKEKISSDDFIILRNSGSVSKNLFIKSINNIHYSTNFNMNLNMRNNIYIVTGFGVGFDNMYIHAFDEINSNFKAIYTSRPFTTQLNFMIGFKKKSIFTISPYLGYVLKHSFQADIDFQDTTLNKKIENKTKPYDLGLAKVSSVNYHTLTIGLLIHI